MDKDKSGFWGRTASRQSKEIEELNKQLKESLKYVKYIANDCKGSDCKNYSKLYPCEGCLCGDAKIFLNSLKKD